MSLKTWMTGIVLVLSLWAMSFGSGISVENLNVNVVVEHRMDGDK